MENSEYARILEEIAALHRVAGDTPYKARAFERAARVVASLPEPVDDLVDSYRVESIKGIGESIAEELRAMRTRGSSPRHQELLERIDPGILEIMQIPWLGSKRLRILYHELGIKNLAAFKEALKSGRLREHPEFGKALEDKLLPHIDRFERTHGRRLPLPEAKGLADSLCFQFMRLPEVEMAAPGGSIRRGEETVGDIDLAIASDHPRRVIDYFKTLPEIVQVNYEGGSRASAIMTGEIKVDIWIEPPEVWGANIYFVTGDKDHHVEMRKRARKLGLKMREYGVVSRDDPQERPIASMRTEEDVFAAVDLPYIPVEIRTGGKEIELAEKGQLPRLLFSSDLKGDVHVHTAADGGRDALEELARAAVERGYEWLVITDRCSRSGDRGCSPEEFRARLDLIERCDREISDIRLISGVETEILPDGTLDADHRLLARCEFVMATVTTDYDMDASAMTQRIVWGIETGLISCLASPTGRHLGVHEGYDMYFEELIDAAIDYNVALELSGDPVRLDLNASRAAHARKRGVLLAVGSNASSALALSNVDYATQQARRGWLGPDDVLNTLSADEMLGKLRTLIG